jgi:hypothetical protein
MYAYVLNDHRQHSKPIEHKLLCIVAFFFFWKRTHHKPSGHRSLIQTDSVFERRIVSSFSAHVLSFGSHEFKNMFSWFCKYDKEAAEPI